MFQLRQLEGADSFKGSFDVLLRNSKFRNDVPHDENTRKKDLRAAFRRDYNHSAKIPVNNAELRKTYTREVELGRMTPFLRENVEKTPIV